MAKLKQTDFKKFIAQMSEEEMRNELVECQELTFDKGNMDYWVIEHIHELNTEYLGI